MTQYYKLNNGYPVISTVKVEVDMIEYTVGSEPQVLLEAISTQKLKEINNKIKDESLTFLKDTDWYISREIETGKKIPENIKKLREEARLRIN